MNVLYVGNFGPAYSTESHVSHSFELAGHTVYRVQEEDGIWEKVPQLADMNGSRVVVWTRTWGLDRDLDRQIKGLDELRTHGIISCAIHLDKFFGLPREDQLTIEPWFKCDWVFTADGGNQEGFHNLGINHHWLPPGVYEPECYEGTPRYEYTYDIGFVGSWQGHYHPEWSHRQDLVNWLARTYKRRVRFWPQGKAVRGSDLNDLYASVKILVGDSCMVDQKGYYWSDRVPECTGRGGFLLHPSTPGLTDYHNIATWNLGDWNGLRSSIDYYLSDTAARNALRLQCHHQTKSLHTYTHRVRTVLETMGLSDE